MFHIKCYQNQMKNENFEKQLQGGGGGAQYPILSRKIRLFYKTKDFQSCLKVSEPVCEI